MSIGVKSASVLDISVAEGNKKMMDATTCDRDWWQGEGRAGERLIEDLLTVQLLLGDNYLDETREKISIHRLMPLTFLPS